MKFPGKFISLCMALIIMSGIFTPNDTFGITIKEEEALSREFMKVISTHYKIIKDPLIANYVNQVGQKIVSNLPPQPFSYHFYVIKEDVYNAFAIPAGYIFINSGLFMAMDNEEELAGILSHEIAHVVCRHISQKIDRSKQLNIAMLAGMAAGMLLGVAGAAAVANAVTIGSAAAGQSTALAHSRADERQADQIGLLLDRKAGYNGEGMLDMLKKIRSKQWFDTNEVPTYLQTHPGSEERMMYIDTWLANHKETLEKIDPYDFDRAHTRLVAVYGDKDLALKKFKSAVKHHPDNPLAHYGYALVLERNGDYESAEEQIKIALGEKAFDPYILKELGLIYFHNGQYQKALNILESATGIISNDFQARFYLGRAQTELGHLKDAEATFKELIKRKYDNPRVYFSLAQVYGKLGEMDNAHYYLGIYYHKKGELDNAAFHLTKALEQINDPQKRADIEKMMKEIRGQKHRLTKEEKDKTKEN